MLAGLVLCTTVGFAAEAQKDAAAEGRKRNEQVIERMLEQTGWKNKKSVKIEKEPQGTDDHFTEASRPKSS